MLRIIDLVYFTQEEMGDDRLREGCSRLQLENSNFLACMYGNVLIDRHAWVHDCKLSLLEHMLYRSIDVSCVMFDVCTVVAGSGMYERN
jgi:hypothetical protein